MRKDAEISYLRKYFKDYEAIKSDDQLLALFMLSNPRFEQILSKYGTPVGSNLSKAELDKKKFLGKSSHN